MRQTSLVAAALAIATALTSASASAATDTPVYMESRNTAATLQVLATSGDTIGNYTLPGVPDGIGVRKNGSMLQLFLNHEISPSASAVKRAGGAITGSTVSSLTFDPATGKITSAEEAIKSVTWYDYNTGKYGAIGGAPYGAAALDAYNQPLHTTAVARFCSSNLVQDGELAVKDGGITYGYSGAVYFTGEESGDESRAFALNTNGELVQLGAFGLGSWENIVRVPSTNRVSAFMLDEDGSATDSQLFMYVGSKQQPTANSTTTSKVRVPATKSRKAYYKTVTRTVATTVPWYQAAGLTNGSMYVMRIGDFAIESTFRASVGKGASTPVTFAKYDATLNGKVQNGIANVLGTSLARIEDGSFDPAHPNDYYFITTESNKDAKATVSDPATPTIKRDGGALWRLRFKDVNDPLAGASITMLLDGTEAPYLNKPDNLTIDAAGNLLIQEDPGNSDHLSRLLAYRIADGKLAVLAQFKKQYFASSETATFMTIDEESSGVIDVTPLLRKGETDKAGYFFFDAQVHVAPSIARPDITDPAARKAIDTAAVEGGQLYLLTISDWSVVYGS